MQRDGAARGAAGQGRASSSRDQARLELQESFHTIILTVSSVSLKTYLCGILQNSFLVLDLSFQNPRGSVKTLRILVNLFISPQAGRLTGFSYT